jgi:hypothetical protein
VDKNAQAILDDVSFYLLILFFSWMFISSAYTYFIHAELVQFLLFSVDWRVVAIIFLNWYIGMLIQT